MDINKPNIIKVLALSYFVILLLLFTAIACLAQDALPNELKSDFGIVAEYFCVSVILLGGILKWTASPSGSTARRSLAIALIFVPLLCSAYFYKEYQFLKDYPKSSHESLSLFNIPLDDEFTRENLDKWVHELAYMEVKNVEEVRHDSGNLVATVYIAPKATLLNESLSEKEGERQVKLKITSDKDNIIQEIKWLKNDEKRAIPNVRDTLNAIRKGMPNDPIIWLTEAVVWNGRHIAREGESRGVFLRLYKSTPLTDDKANTQLINERLSKAKLYKMFGE